MSTAVLVATAPAEDHSAAALLSADGRSVLARMAEQLAAHGVSTFHVVTTPAWGDDIRAALPGAQLHLAPEPAAAFEAVSSVAAQGGPLVVAEANAVMHGGVLTVMVDDPRVATGYLVDKRGGAASCGLMKVAATDAATLANQAAAVASRLRTPAAGGSGGQPDGHAAKVLQRSDHDEVVEALLNALTVSGVQAQGVSLRRLFHRRVRSQAEAAAAMVDMAAVDEEKALLNAAVKENDGFFGTFFASPYTRYIARWAARRGITPNQVTVVAMAVATLAAAAFAVGTRAGLIAGAVLLQVAFVGDVVDGQLARYTRQFSTLGAWLDAVSDRTKEYMVFAALAYGATRVGDDMSIWVLAAGALIVQTVRHTVDFGFAAVRNEPQQREVAAAAAAVQAAPQRPRRGRARLGQLGVRSSVYFEQRPVLKWTKRIITMPIGERFALISVTAAFAGPRTTFLSLIIWGLVAMTYTASGRILRTLLA